ncbi:MAG: hypothetical protein LZF86_40076 [Nitrospira sp.]|nr:MAG: hypothetical protein LZF86_40076 [Nitrospira sp.]
MAMIRVESQPVAWKVGESRNDRDVHCDVSGSVVVNEKDLERSNRPDQAAVFMRFMNGDTVAADLKGKQHAASYDARGPLSRLPRPPRFLQLPDPAGRQPPPPPLERLMADRLHDDRIACSAFSGTR